MTGDVAVGLQGLDETCHGRCGDLLGACQGRERARTAEDEHREHCETWSAQPELRIHRPDASNKVKRNGVEIEG